MYIQPFGNSLCLLLVQAVQFGIQVGYAAHRYHVRVVVIHTLKLHLPLGFNLVFGDVQGYECVERGRREA